MSGPRAEREAVPEAPSPAVPLVLLGLGALGLALAFLREPILPVLLAAVGILALVLASASYGTCLQVTNRKEG